MQWTPLGIRCITIIELEYEKEQWLNNIKKVIEMTEKKRVGKMLDFPSSSHGQQVYIMTNKGEMVPFAKMKRYEIKKDSQQLKQEMTFGIDRIIAPPFAPLSFISLEEECSVLNACIEQVSHDVVGNGYRLVLNEDIEEENDEILKEKEGIQQLFRKVNSDGDTLRQVIQRAVSDYECMGWFGIEVVRKRNLNPLENEPELKVSELWHVPGHTLRLHEDKKRIVQRLNGKQVWYKKYGCEENVRASDGAILPTEADVTDSSVGNEMIFYKNYYRKSSYYGAPKVLSAVGSVVGLIGIRDYNISFFENFGVPAALVTLSGAWEKGTAKKLKDFLDSEIRGSDNQHKTAVFETPEGCTLDWKPLNIEVKEGSFKIIRKDFTTDVLVAYRMPEERVGLRTVGELGGNVAVEATRIYNASIIEPIQLSLEELINQVVLVEGLGAQYYTFKLNSIDIRDIDLRVDRYKKLFDMGAITPNKIIKKLDLGAPYPGGDKYYLPQNVLEVGEDESVAKSQSLMEILESLKKEAEKNAK
jgi:capsid portal protein